MKTLLLFLSATFAYGQGWTTHGNGSIFHLPGTHDVCPINGYNGIPWAFNDTCATVWTEWGGAAADIRRNRLLNMGGGHGAATTIDNGIYVLNVNTTPATANYLTRPGTVGVDQYKSNGYQQTPDTPPQPITGHTYDCLVYARVSDKFFLWGQMDKNGEFQNANVWLADVSQSSPPWAKPAYTGSNGYGSVAGASCILDPTTDDENILIVVPVGGYSLYRYNVTTSAWTTLNAGGMGAVYGTVGVDPIRKKLYAQTTNGTAILRVDLTSGSNFQPVDITSQLGSSCSFWKTNIGVGMEWDTSINRFVLYPKEGGDNIYIFDPGSMTCVQQTFSGGPVAIYPINVNGIFHNFSYFPSLGLYTAMNNPTGQAYTLKINNSPQNGLAKTILTTNAPTCLDRDGDGYGTGCVSGNDSDDLDPTIHTFAQACTKWGGGACDDTTTRAVLRHKGYVPTNIFYISASGTNSLTGGVPTCKNSFSTPCATPAYVQGYMANGGDAVFMRDTGGELTNIGEFQPPSGVSGNPNYVLGAPGERPYCNNGSTHLVCVNLTGRQWIVVDGLKVRAGGTQAGAIAIGGLTTGTEAGVIIRNNEGLQTHNAPLMGFNLGTNYMIEFNVWHDGSCTPDESCGVNDGHNAYIGANAYASKDVGFVSNILYNSISSSFQYNGRVQNLTFEGNLIYASEDSTCATFFNGVSRSFIRGNLMFNCGNDAVQFADYDGNCPTGGFICPYDQNYNIISNNTIFLASTGPTGNDLTNHGAWHVYNVTAPIYNRPLTQDLGHNIYRNNAFVISSANTPIWTFGIVLADIDSNNLSALTTSTFENNMVYRISDGGSNVNVFGTGKASTYWTFYTWSSITSIVPNVQVTNNSFTDPKFTAANSSWGALPGNYDFHLKNTAPLSPAIGAGSPKMVPTIDLGGLLRTWAAPSIGAFELTPPPCAINETSLPPGQATVSYSTSLTVNGACNTSSYVITSGSLPPGLTLHSGTGVIDGTPTTQGSYPFTVLYDTGSQPYTLIINPLGINGGIANSGQSATSGKTVRK